MAANVESKGASMKNTLKSIRNKLHGDIHSAMNASRADIKSDLTEIKESLSTTAKKITPPILIILMPCC